MDLARGYRKKADTARLLARQLAGNDVKDAYLAKAADYDRRADWIELERIRNCDRVVPPKRAAMEGWSPVSAH